MRIAVRAHGRFALMANASIVSLLSEILVRRDTNEGKRNKWPHRRQNQCAFPKSYLAPVALVFKDRLDAFSLFKMSLLKLSDPRMARDSLAEGAESADALGVHLSILGITAFRREGECEDVAREDATRTPHGRAIDCIPCFILCVVRKRVSKSFSFRRGWLDVGPCCPRKHTTTL